MMLTSSPAHLISLAAAVCTPRSSVSCEVRPDRPPGRGRTRSTVCFTTSSRRLFSQTGTASSPSTRTTAEGRIRITTF
ncbi:hypothetical protein PF008_g15475 [Phytophthora fragariae]|uniref:Secreted protein n=1 Tax=Phytophthora fragariae TaxID=53985 RepID=A0A6G0REV7_9STRA|nr:hypothetical protein PF008_g15475 [Phytophthora fragariae]